LRRQLELARALVRAGGATAEILGRKQDQPVDREKGRGSLRVGEQRPQLVLEDEPDQAGRDRADHE
jgi:hypothetical protein